MFKKINLLVSLVILVFLFGCSNENSVSNQEKQPDSASKQKAELVISAAASLQDALYEIEKNYEKNHNNIDLKFNFGSSGALKQQIEQGAPVDLFFSAAEDKFDELVNEGEIDGKQSVDLVGNELVLIVPKDTKKSIKEFLDLPAQADSIALGTPEAVPAGMYAKQTLEKLGLWNQVSGKVIPAKDVRQVLSYVETGNVDAGIVYKTDALVSDKVKVVTTADASMHDPIIYPVGVIKDTKQPIEAEKFYKYLQNKESLKVLENYGFLTK